LLKLTVNGEPREVAAATVFDLIQELGLHPQGTIVERNLEIVDLTSYRETRLAEGDVLELVRLVGGG
jgi:thiamine biosynthesis protein ThiS